MHYEVEKRALLKSDVDFNRIKRFLYKQGKFLGKKNLKTLLFRKPTYLRFRSFCDVQKQRAEVTFKSGDYGMLSRKEINLDINPKQITDFIELLKAVGYKKGVFIKTERHYYKFRGLLVELNKIDYLGKIVEVEGLTNDKRKVGGLRKKIDDILEILQVQELSGEDYQGMMDDMFKKGLKKINEYELK